MTSVDDVASDGAIVDAGTGSADAAEPSDPFELGMASGQACDPVLQDCPQGEKCSATRWDTEQGWPAPACILDLEGLGASSRAPCLGAPGLHDGCGPGLGCFNAGTGEGYCVELCSADPDVCPADAVCAPVDPTSGLSLCLPACEVNEDCVFVMILQCVERQGVRFCDSIR